MTNVIGKCDRLQALMTNVIGKRDRLQALMTNVIGKCGWVASFFDPLFSTCYNVSAVSPAFRIASSFLPAACGATTPARRRVWVGWKKVLAIPTCYVPAEVSLASCETPPLEGKSMTTIQLALPDEIFAALRRSPDEIGGELRRAAAIFW